MNRIAQFIVTTALITLLAYPGTAPSLNVAGTVRVNTLTVAGGGGGGGGCTVNSGNVFNECFENTGSPGYDLTWTEVSGNPDENSALPAALARIGSQCFRVNLTSDTTIYARKDEGSAVTSGTRWFRIYFYWDSDDWGNGNGDGASLVSGWETTDTTDVDQRAFTSWVTRDTDGLGVQVRGDTATSRMLFNIDTWYYLQIQWVRGSSSEAKLYLASNDTQVGTTQTFTAGGLADWRYTVIGQYAADLATGTAANYYLDGLGVDSTAYLGQ